ncbi:hypothetical protein C8035_v004771 [Colletotrichum spinosum]|uniref:Arrestin-like N-terminal domain-containing protein n=1 Tax=Colletotrichum spinosum TaxID=1347390 RepID=A0A4R8QHT0_9PEZI|nr:hypothetical protein C8035_v004771 [Colletotrichum spinosum]
MPVPLQLLAARPARIAARPGPGPRAARRAPEVGLQLHAAVAHGPRRRQRGPLAGAPPGLARPLGGRPGRRTQGAGDGAARRFPLPRVPLRGVVHPRRILPRGGDDGRGEEDGVQGGAAHPGALRPVRDAADQRLPAGDEVHGRVVATHHLVPRRTDEKLSWEQRLQNLVRSPAVPRFSFELRVDFPKQLQLGNPSPVPFRLRLLPRDEGTSDMVRDSHQTVFVTKVTLEVHTTVGTACPGLLGLYDSWIKKRNLLGKVRRPASNRRGLVLPVGEHVEPLDIGASFGLRLGAARLIMDPALVTGDGCEQLPPTTTTYTHSIEHKLHWEVEISIASEAARWSGTQHIVVLPAGGGGGDDGSEAGPPPGKNADVPLVYQTPDLGAGRKGLGRTERMKPRGGVVTVLRAWPGQLSESYL